MIKRIFLKILYFVGIAILLLFYQNCSQGFEVAQSQSSSSVPTVALECADQDCQDLILPEELPKDCFFNGEVVEDGKSIIAFFDSSSNQCLSESRVCRNGELSGNYLFAICTDQARACLFDGRTIVSGTSVKAYQRQNGNNGSVLCQEENRSCNNGNLSGSYSLGSCTPIAEQSPCLLNGITIPHNGLVKAYQASSVTSPATCQVENRFCINGQLSGSYANLSCVENQSGGGNLNASLNDDIFYIGHSLVGPMMPNMLRSLITHQGGSGGVDYQIINGSPLKYNWDNSASAEGSNSKVVLPRGMHEVVVMTEAVPLKNHTTYSQSNEMALQFYNLALSAKPMARVYMYETWHCINSGTPAGCEYDDNGNIAWRTRLNQELSRWEGIVNYVNANKTASAPNMLIIPAGQAMAELYDEMIAGRVPGLSNINQLFQDDIHPNALGFYFVSMVQFATIYGRSPVGLPRILSNGSGGNYTAPSQELAQKMQEVAWKVVCSYPRAGLSCSGAN